jgi:hypothetical protein
VVLTISAKKAGSFCLFGIWMLASCAPAITTQIESSSVANTPIAPGNVVLILPAKIGPNAEWLSARDAVLGKLAAKGFSVAEPAAYSLEVTLASRPADLALATMRDGANVVLASGNGKKGAKNCVNNDYRINIALSRLSDGAMLYKGTASENHCKAPLGEVVPFLVDTAMNDFGSPKGTYAVTRKKSKITL